jgi:hypothetical protein|tara:strand:- start:64 stop:381 length:318 start_codon:yes stop_codon:yes gene_type:complete
MKKNFMCTHTWSSDEARIAFFEQSAGLTDRQLFEGMRTDSAELLANWMGKEDFFYCHWLAESEDAIFEALDQLGLNDVMVSMPHEMSRFVTHDNIKDEVLDNPYE